jgi:hypothetical protein
MAAEADRVELLAGALEAVTVETQSGGGQKIFSYPTCRIMVWSNYLRVGWRRKSISTRSRNSLGWRCGTTLQWSKIITATTRICPRTD